MKLRPSLWRAGSPLITNVALALMGVIAIELCRTGVNEYHHFVHGYSETVFAQLAIYLGAISLVERCPVNRWTLALIFAVALAARLICVFSPPFLSTDIYRYVWDGKVQSAGINPFRYIPADPHLASLRDGSIYPYINRRETAHTIYPPGAQAIFLAIARLRPTVTAMKVSMVGFEAVTCIVLLRIFRLLSLPPQRIVIYAWHPLCYWEIASSGHIDAAALTFIALAIYARLKEKPGGVGGWLAAATLTKIYPAALLPAFFERRRTGRSAWKMPALFASIIAIGYACYASVGLGVFGYLPGYAQEEGLDSGSRFFLVSFANRALHARITPWVYLICCGLMMLALCLWALRKADQPLTFLFTGLVLATMLNVFYSPHYPWYFLWLLPYLAIYPWRPAFYLAAASTYLFGTNLGAPGEPLYHLNILLYSGFAFMLVYEYFAHQFARHPLEPAKQSAVRDSSLIGTPANGSNL